MSVMSNSIAPFTTLEMTGMLTVAMITALLVIALSFRIVRIIASIRHYEGACQQVALIEEKLKDMQEYIRTLEQDFEKNTFDLKQKHAKERFELQQTIFTRNSEIIELKHKLSELSKLVKYEHS